MWHALWEFTEQNTCNLKSYMDYFIHHPSKVFNAKLLLVELDVTKGEIRDRMNMFYVRRNKTTFNTAEMFYEKLIF